ncbi:hypothetical protein FOZ63_014203, partial [Perkinsus olseni]
GSTSKAVPAAAANRQAVRPASTTTSGEVDTAQYAKDIRAMADELTAMIDRLNCDPIIVRFAWHDTIQLASACALKHCGGPDIIPKMKFGRKDISGPEECPPEGRLPNPEGADHLRKIFY